jgi:hypothetical protein
MFLEAERKAAEAEESAAKAEEAERKRKREEGERAAAAAAEAQRATEQQQGRGKRAARGRREVEEGTRDDGAGAASRGEAQVLRRLEKLETGLARLTDIVVKHVSKFNDFVEHQQTSINTITTTLLASKSKGGQDDEK